MQDENLLADENAPYRATYVANLVKRRAELEVVISTYRRAVRR